MELEYGSHVDDPSSCWLNRLPEVVLSNFYTPPNNASIACLQYEIGNPDLKQEEEAYFMYSSVIPLMAFTLKDMDLLHIIISKNWMTDIIQKNI